jgi:branched-chain amino acid transport system substrate-binding protein
MHHRKRVVRAVSAISVIGIVALGLNVGVSGAQASPEPGVTTKSVRIGFISPQTGVASTGVYTDAHRACEARVDAENATGGVHGRKINLRAIDDQSGGANLTAAQELVEQYDAFAVVNASAVAFLAHRYLRDSGVPMLGVGVDGTYYYDKGNEGIISGVGASGVVPGITYDMITRVMKQMGATKVAAVGYAVSPGSSLSAKAIESAGAEAAGLEGVYLNNTLEFGTTDVGPVALGIKNSGADAVWMALDADTNFALVQALQQNGVKLKAAVLGTGYSQDLLDEPLVESLPPDTVMITSFRPVELGGRAVKEFQGNLKKYAGVTGVPQFGTYMGYILCDMVVQGLDRAGKNPTRQGFVDGIRGLRSHDGAGLTCKPIAVGLDSFGKLDPNGCAWFVGVKDGRFVVLSDGKPVKGKMVGDPELLAKYGINGSGATTTTTTTPDS